MMSRIEAENKSMLYQIPAWMSCADSRTFVTEHMKGALEGPGSLIRINYIKASNSSASGSRCHNEL